MNAPDPRACPRPLRHEAWLPALLALAAFTFLFVPSLLRWQGFGVQSFDFGIYAHGFWNASEGNGFVSSIEYGDHLKSHAAPMLYALLPFYSLAPSPLTLLALSSALLALAVFPLWRLARRHHGPVVSGLAAVLLVVQPATASLSFDLHEAQLALPLLLALFVAADEARPGPFFVFLLAALACKENVALVTGALGLVMLARPGVPRRLGAAAVVLSIAWLALAVGWFIPLFGGDHAGATMVRYAHLGDSWGALLLSPFTRPQAFWGTLFSADSAAYLGKLFVSWGFLPLFAPRSLLVAAPILLQNLLSGHEPMRSLWFHYEALLLPVLAWASVEGLARFARWSAAASPAIGAEGSRRFGAWKALVLLSLLAAAPALQARWGHGFLNAVGGDPDAAEYAEVLARVPPGVSVAAPPLLQPYLADRPVAAYFGPQNPALRERATSPVPPSYAWMIVPTGASRAGRPVDSFRVADFPEYEILFETAHLALVKRR